MHMNIRLSNILNRPYAVQCNVCYVHWELIHVHTLRRTDTHPYCVPRAMLCLVSALNISPARV